MTRRFVFLVGLVLSFQVSFGQNDDIKTVFNNYIKSTKSTDVREQIDFLYPKQFEYFSRDTLVTAYEMLQENPSVQLGEEKLISISEIYSENGIKYALITFAQKMTLDLSAMKGEGGVDFAIQLMLKEFKNAHGEDNVVFEKEKYTVLINLTNEMYSILDPKYNDWKFLSKDDDMKSIYNSIVPETIKEKI